MKSIYIILLIIIVFLLLCVMLVKRTEKVRVAFAGSYDGKGTVKKVYKDRNRTIYTEGEKKVDLSNYEKFLISGRSLEKVGISDGSFVYTQPIKTEKELHTLCGRFVVFKYDNDRLREEHPEITDLVEDGFKARKVVAIFSNGLEEEAFNNKITPILSVDKDIDDVESCKACLWKKYAFASKYYKDDSNLIVSITYKDGEKKDYSFHSFKFLQGVVKYKSL